jgi:hypothetical protein
VGAGVGVLGGNTGIHDAHNLVDRIRPHGAAK